MADINLPIIIGAAAVDSINPCAFGVLIFLLAYLAETGKRMLLNGITYIVGVFVTYFIAGVLLLPVIRKIAQASVWVYLIIGTIIILAGLLEIKDFFWYGRWFSLSIFPSEVQRIKAYVKKVSNKLSTAFFLGVFVAIVELPCTGAAYLAVLTLMSLSGLNISNFTLLVLYNIIFVLPLVIILLLANRGMSAHQFEEWRERNKRWMRLAIGLVLVGLGVWMMAIVL